MREATTTSRGLQRDWHMLSTFENLLCSDLWQGKHCKPPAVPESDSIDRWLLAPCLIHWKHHLKLRVHQLRKRYTCHAEVQVPQTALLTLTKPPPVTLLCLQPDCSKTQQDNSGGGWVG